jgi:glycosyltransferase involved in cell wall biosynthesis
MTRKVGVLHLVDSLDAGGAEHAAVMLANNLPQDRYSAYLCASRHAGPLQSRIQPHVRFLNLRRRHRFDVSSVCKLAQYIHQENINIIHTHMTSLFLGTILCLLNPSLRLVWHDHFGAQEITARSVFLYRPFARRAQAILTVTRQLAKWAIDSMGVLPERVLYLPNFVEQQEESTRYLNLPGERGKRIVSVANIRSQKDHFTLVRAMKSVVQVESGAQLLLVGAETDIYLAAQLRHEIQHLGLAQNITWLGSRKDVPQILGNCDIGVLSSTSEGFPIVLLEYGRARLGVVSTQVGECQEILEAGKAGILVPPSNPDCMASALLRLLNSHNLIKELGERLARRVKQNYSTDSILKQVCQVYDCIL